MGVHINIVWQRNMELSLSRRRIDAIPDSKLFRELERIWTSLGHRPSRTEWESSQPEVSYITYRRRFGGWINACSAFIEYKMGTPFDSALLTPVPKLITDEEKRDVPLKMRLKVLERDSFACILCGRTPALTKGVILHIDHKVAFAEGGKSVIENLQTLCSDCNWGKGKSKINA
jgi:hypothetical protein